MAMPDTTRPDDEGEPEEFKDDDSPFDGDGVRNEGDAPTELELGDEGERLPWLEAEDDEEEYGSGGGQIALLLLLAFGALALIIGAIWWFTRDKTDQTLVADGSLIEAPDEPYKTKPEDPGGKTFQGTGDTSYAVSEGESRPAQLGTAAETPKPGFETVETPASEDTPAASTGPAVQVGAFSTRATAESGWRRLSSQHSALKGLSYRVVEGKADFGTVFRLQALPNDEAAARKLCSTLKAAGQGCSIKN